MSWGPRTRHSPPRMGRVEVQRDAGTGPWHGPRSRCRSQRRVDPSRHATCPFIRASVTCCPLLPSPALQRAFMRNWLRFSHRLGPLATAGLLRLCPFFHLPQSSSRLLRHSVSVSLNSARTPSLPSLEIRVLAHPLEQLQPSVKGGTALIRSAAAPRDSRQQT